MPISAKVGMLLKYIPAAAFGVFRVVKHGGFEPMSSFVLVSVLLSHGCLVLLVRHGPADEDHR
jgi:hypothetical protein